MLEGIPQEGAPIIPNEAEASVGEIIKAPLTGAVEAPVVYLPKEMPTDKAEYDRVLQSINEQAAKIISDRAVARQAVANHEEFNMMEEAGKENHATLAQMDASQQNGLGFFSRFADWMRGKS